MTRITVSISLLLMYLLFASGCSNKSTEQPPPTAGQTEGGHDHSGHEHTAADMEKVKAELAKLPPEDAASAESQHICPVSGEMLGSMGAPKKVDVNGTQVWICCDGCREKLIADADTYLAKLKKR
jgi:hypothetical protein